MNELRKGLALAALILGAAMMMLDVTIVNVALPTMRDSLDADEATLAWIVSGYALASGLALIPAGRLGDRIGHRPVFLAGVAVFTLASLWAGATSDATWLIVARVVQGLGGGLLFPAIGAFIQLMYQGAARARAFAVQGAAIGVFTALGPLVGGVIIEAFGDADGWRWIFYVNVPFGLLAVVAGFVLLPSGGEDRASRGFDGVGLALVAAGLVAVLVPLIEGEDAGWAWWTWVSMLAGIAILIGFAGWEVRRSRRGLVQLVPPRLFAHRSFTGGLVLGFVYFAAFTSIFFVIALYWQAGLGHSALESGLVVLPFSIGAIVGAGLSGRLSRRLGRTILLIGTGAVAAGYLSVWALMVAVPVEGMQAWVLAAPLLVAGFGNGCFIAPNTQFIVATVDRRDAGAAQGVVSTIQRIGSAAGIAVVGAVLFGALDETAIQAAAREGASVAARAVAEAFTAASSWGVLVSAGAALAAFGLVWTLPRRTMGEPGPSAVGGAPQSE